MNGEKRLQSTVSTKKPKIFIICLTISLLMLSFLLPAGFAGAQDVVQTSVNISGGRKIQSIEDVDKDYVRRLMAAGKYTDAGNYLDKAINSLNKEKYASDIAELRMINALSKYKAGDTKGAKAEYNELKKFYGKNTGSFRVFIAEANAAYDVSVQSVSDEETLQNLTGTITPDAPEFTDADRKKISKLIKKKKYKELAEVLDGYLSRYSEDNDIEMYTALVELRAAAKHKAGDEEGAKQDYELLQSIYGSVFDSYENFIHAADKAVK